MNNCAKKLIKGNVPMGKLKSLKKLIVLFPLTCKSELLGFINFLREPFILPFPLFFSPCFL